MRTIDCSLKFEIRESHVSQRGIFEIGHWWLHSSSNYLDSMVKHGYELDDGQVGRITFYVT